MATRYCICRSRNGAGFMVGCDRCLEWFHGRCIDITRKFAENIEKYYCDACRKCDPGLKTVYKSGFVPPPPPPLPPVEAKSQATNFDKPFEEPFKKKEKKVLEKVQSSKTSSSSSKKLQPTPQAKVSSGRKRGNAKSKDHSKKRCANPDCIYETRQDSKYCSDDCGYAFNKLRYERFYSTKFTQSKDDYSLMMKYKRKELQKLYNDRKDTIELIGNLKLEKEELEKTIARIKEEATKQAKINSNIKKEKDDDEDEDMNEDSEEIASGEASKTFCVTCGLLVVSTMALRHWATCHKKNESVYNFTADAIVQHSCDGDKEPKLYCHHQDKKTKRYCMHLESACPQHSNWYSIKDEVCGCPQTNMQKLVFEENGSYCLELKKNCTLHYHWDKFRLAQMNMQRIQAFNKLDAIFDKIRIGESNYADSYGGVVGVMLHNTIDYKTKDSESPNLEDQLEYNADVDLVN